MGAAGVDERAARVGVRAVLGRGAHEDSGAAHRAGGAAAGGGREPRAPQGRPRVRDARGAAARRCRVARVPRGRDRLDPLATGAKRPGTARRDGSAAGAGDGPGVAAARSVALGGAAGCAGRGRGGPEEDAAHVPLRTPRSAGRPHRRGHAALRERGRVRAAVRHLPVAGVPGGEPGRGARGAGRARRDVAGGRCGGAVRGVRHDVAPEEPSSPRRTCSGPTRTSRTWT